MSADFCTRTLCGADVLAVNNPVPAYAAVTACTPAPCFHVTLSVATPFTSPAVPSVVAPSLNVTAPVALADPGAVAVTTALSVVACPSVTEVVGSWSVVTVADTVAAVTVTPIAPDALPKNTEFVA